MRDLPQSLIALPTGQSSPPNRLIAWPPGAPPFSQRKKVPLRIHQLFLFAILPVALLTACDDGGSGGSGGTGGSGGSGGSGAAGGSGGAGGGTTATGGSGGGTTATGGSGGGTTTTGTGGSGGGMGACTNAADTTVLTNPSTDVPAEINACAQDNLGQEPATLNCIKALGLSDECAVCFDDTVKCVIEKCLNDCISDQNSQACKDCRAANCDPAFETCSGLDAQ